MSWFRHKMFLYLFHVSITYNFCPKFVMTYFERGFMSTYKSIWKDVLLLNCNFHFRQCQWRAIVILDQDAKNKTFKTRLESFL